MARYTTSLRDVVERWATRRVLSVDAETHQSGGGLYGASMTVSTDAARIDLTVVSVEATARSSLDQVQQAFDQFIDAPGDAALLAAEVKRLTAENKRLKQMAGGADEGTQE